MKSKWHLLLLALLAVVVLVAADTTVQTKVYKTDGGDKIVVANGGTLDVESGGNLKIAGVTVTASAAELNYVDGGLGRANLIEDELAAYGIPVNQIMAADGAPLAVAETAGDHFLNLGTNLIMLRGEEANNETEASVSYVQFVLPPEYVAAGDVKVRLRCKIDGAGTNNGSTIDISAYEQADGAVGGDLCTTAAETFAAKTTWYSKDFTITATGLVAGDILVIKITSSVTENAAAALAFYADPPKILLDVKG